MIRWWHRNVLKHSFSEVRVSVKAWDVSAKGLLVTCQCGKVWAL